MNRSDLLAGAAGRHPRWLYPHLWRTLRPLYCTCRRFVMQR